MRPRSHSVRAPGAKRSKGNILSSSNIQRNRSAASQADAIQALAKKVNANSRADDEGRTWSQYELQLWAPASSTSTEGGRWDLSDNIVHICPMICPEVWVPKFQATTTAADRTKLNLTKMDLQLRINLGNSLVPQPPKQLNIMLVRCKKGQHAAFARTCRPWANGYGSGTFHHTPDTEDFNDKIMESYFSTMPFDSGFSMFGLLNGYPTTGNLVANPGALTVLRSTRLMIGNETNDSVALETASRPVTNIGNTVKDVRWTVNLKHQLKNTDAQFWRNISMEEVGAGQIYLVMQWGRPNIPTDGVIPVNTGITITGSAMFTGYNG